MDGFALDSLLMPPKWKGFENRLTLGVGQVMASPLVCRYTGWPFPTFTHWKVHHQSGFPLPDFTPP
jgi:hypothetical protein